MMDNSKEMPRLYDQWLSGSNNKALFCRQHKINYTTFHYRVKKFRKEDSLSPACSQDNGFSRISIAETTASDQSILPAAVLFQHQEKVNSGNFIISPPFFADSCASIPTQVILADCFALG